MNPWDFSDMDPNIQPNTGSDCSIDLKLGGTGDFGFREHRGSSKRARAPGTGSQNVSCLVDGCKSDLSGCREYHKRHKVCEVHSKTPIVSVGGHEQRFCQQCSRFHLLVEFDEEKRSCRKRLDGHNRRRRKPQPDSINSASSFTNYQGSIFSSCSQIFSTTTTDPHWPLSMKSEEDPFYSQQHHHYSSMFPQNFKESKHFPFLQNTNFSQPLHNTTPSAGSSSSKVLVSECALSLLSSPPLAHIAQFADRIPMGQPLLSFGGGHVSSTAFSDASDPDINCTQGLFGVGGEGSSDGGTQTLPFSW